MENMNFYELELDELVECWDMVTGQMIHIDALLIQKRQIERDARWVLDMAWWAYYDIMDQMGRVNVTEPEYAELGARLIDKRGQVDVHLYNHSYAKDSVRILENDRLYYIGLEERLSRALVAKTSPAPGG